MIAEGPFDVKRNSEPPFDVVDGVTLARATFEKRFSGPLEATSKVHMMSALTPEDSGAYVAVERVTGALAGKRGTFVLVHLGLGEGTERSLRVTVVPRSGTGELRGLAGEMNIIIQEDGKHFYRFEYTL